MSHRSDALNYATRIVNTMVMQDRVPADMKLNDITDLIIKHAEKFVDFMGADPVRQSWGGGAPKVEKPDYDKPCPVCGGVMVDDRKTKKNPKGPDAYCKNRGKWDPAASKFDGCAGVIWPNREEEYA